MLHILYYIGYLILFYLMVMLTIVWDCRNKKEEKEKIKLDAEYSRHYDTVSATLVSL
jgi:hypothetical protein